MFDFRMRTTSNDSTSSLHSESLAPLTPLPRKLSLRSNTTTMITSHDEVMSTPDIAETPSLFRGNFEGMAELGGTTFAELLGSGDVRESVVLHAGEERFDSRAGEQARERLGEEETILALPGGGWGVAGPDAHLLLRELHRAQIATAQKKRRRTSYISGVISLAVLVFDLWFMIATIVSLARFGGTGRGVLRWIEFTSQLASLVLIGPTIAFLRTRRPSTLGMVAVVSTTLVASLHVALAIANFILTFVWRKQLSTKGRSWDIDVAWADLDAKTTSPTGNGWKGWTVAAVVRFFLVVTVALVWLAAVRLYNRAIHTPFVISPESLPSSELRALLSQHRATIIRLASPPPRLSSHQRSPDWLPAHLDRAQYIQASEVSAAYSYVSEHMRASSAAVEEEAGPGKKSAVATWVRAKVWEGVGWMFGVQPYEESRTTSLDGREKDEVVGDHKADRQHERVGEEEETANRQLQSQDRFSFDIASTIDQAVLDGVDDSRPLTLIDRIFPSKRFSTGSTAPLLPAPSESLSGPINEEEEGAPPLPRKESQHADRSPSSGSSGSTKGQLVYVRMSDGRLVRRLSTIASLDLSEGTERSRRSRSDLSGSFQTGESGLDSFTTARSQAVEHEEILLDDRTEHA